MKKPIMVVIGCLLVGLGLSIGYGLGQSRSRCDAILIWPDGSAKPSCWCSQGAYGRR